MSEKPRKPEKRKEKLCLKDFGFMNNMSLESINDQEEKNKEYNQSHDDWTAFLPGEEEIVKIAKSIESKAIINGVEMMDFNALANAIHKRITGGGQ